MPEIYQPGQLIGRYKIIKHLGTGNYALAYKAEADGKEVFFKQYIDPTEYLGDVFHQFVKQQKRLTEILKDIEEAENIYETFEIDGIHHQAKEWMKGQDLRNYMGAKTGLTTKERRLIAIVFVYGLGKLHEKKIIHNDIKPEQVFLQEEPNIEMKYLVKITDFDFSTIDSEYEAVYKVTTPFYSSPEFLRGERRSYPSDIFTAGIVLYEILCGDIPYDVPSLEEFEKKALAYGARRANQLNPEIPGDVADILFRTLNPNPGQRPSLEEVHKVLIAWSIGGEVFPGKVQFSSSESWIRPVVHKTEVIGREWCRIFPSYVYVSKEQFEIIKGPKSWKIRGLPGVKNETFLNGEKITGVEKDLKSGDEVFIGNKETRKGLILIVKLL
jgi:serine/threonine protein kinase